MFFLPACVDSLVLSTPPLSLHLSPQSTAKHKKLLVPEAFDSLIVHDLHETLMVRQSAVDRDDLAIVVAWGCCL